MDINKLYQYITTYNLINITIKNIAINTGRLWRRPELGQSEIVCTVAILDIQGDTAISLCRERSLARRRALAFMKVRSVARCALTLLNAPPILDHKSIRISKLWLITLLSALRLNMGQRSRALTRKKIKTKFKWFKVGQPDGCQMTTLPIVVLQR